MGFCFKMLAALGLLSMSAHGKEIALQCEWLKNGPGTLYGTQPNVKPDWATQITVRYDMEKLSAFAYHTSDARYYGFSVLPTSSDSGGDYMKCIKNRGKYALFCSGGLSIRNKPDYEFNIKLNGEIQFSLLYPARCFREKIFHYLFGECLPDPLVWHRVWVDSFQPRSPVDWYEIRAHPKKYYAQKAEIYSCKLN